MSGFFLKRAQAGASAATGHRNVWVRLREGKGKAWTTKAKRDKVYPAVTFLSWTLLLPGEPTVAPRARGERTAPQHCGALGVLGWEAAVGSASLSRLSLLPGRLRTGFSGCGDRPRCKGPPQKVGTGASKRTAEDKQLRFLSDVRVKSGSFKLVSHVQNFIKFLALKATQQTVVVAEWEDAQTPAEFTDMQNRPSFNCSKGYEAQKCFVPKSNNCKIRTWGSLKSGKI